MAFFQHDLYLASGTGQLINNFTDPVYKFDSSSFYNWEQDNLPIYDLEERDDFLWEMAGWASSEAPSVMLAVSDCGIDNKKVFGSVSAAIEALPNTIRQPVIIEVCVSGQLGPLNLENKVCTGSGAGIEIINRGFAKMIAGNQTGGDVSAIVNQSLGSSGLPTKAFSLDTSNTMMDTICVGLSGVPVGNKHVGTDTFWNSFGRHFVITPEWSKAADSSVRTVSMSNKFADTAPAMNALANTFGQFVAYEDNSASSDIVISNYSNNPSTVVRRPALETGTGVRATGLFYNNCLSDLSVKNCTGKIYIRGFCVDGVTTQAVPTAAAELRTNVGFDIQGSEVLLENCTATRCKEAGFSISNSEVVLNRGCFAYHNYNLEDTNLVTKDTDIQTPGLRATNSSVTLSASTENFYGLPIDSPFSFTRNMVGIELENSTLQTPEGYRYGTDITGALVTEVYGSETLFLQTFNNVNEGIKATQSVIDHGGYISTYQNRIGAHLVGSTLKAAEITFDHNQEAGLLADNSIFNYNKNAQLIDRDNFLGPQTRFLANGQHAALDNSQFIPTEVSGMPNVYSRLGFSGVFGIDGTSNLVEAGYRSTLPSVVINNGSYMNAVCANNWTAAPSRTLSENNAIYLRPTYGAAFLADNNSTLDLNGTGDFATVITGPSPVTQQIICAGVCANNGSVINVAGPTSIVQYGVDVLGNNNSTINIHPHTKNGALDVSGYLLADSSANHTKVQLHATRACLVVNNNSVLSMENLGDYHQSWADKYIIEPDYPTGSAQTAGLRYGNSYCYGGGEIQFYPNPMLDYNEFPNYADKQAVYPTEVRSPAYTFDNTQSWTNAVFARSTEAEVSSASYGGLCVRATGDSKVKALNVTFPTGWQNTSGAYYSVSASLCEQLRIWNIADNSELHASYLSVGYGSTDPVHPLEMSATYFGPSALWVSSVGGVWGAGLSGAPSSTADTSTASVLDSFGLGVDTLGELGYYGKKVHENVGPFRIYVSPNAVSKFLGFPQFGGDRFNPQSETGAAGGLGPTPYSMGYMADTAVLKTGVPFQVFAQGYNCSSDCSASFSGSPTGQNTDLYPDWQNPSSVYQELGFSSYIDTLPADQQVENVASSFFYTSAMLPNDSASRIWLDDSAINTFANAKNGMLHTSGRKKIFSYYKAEDAYLGEPFNQGNEGQGLGSVSLFDLERFL